MNEQAIARLKATIDEHDRYVTAKGMLYGKSWAEKCASARELARLTAWNEAGSPGGWSGATIYEAVTLSAAKATSSSTVADHFLDDNDPASDREIAELLGAHHFWRGFVRAAIEVWTAVRPQVLKDFPALP